MQATLSKYGFVAFALSSLAIGIFLNQLKQIEIANLVWALGAALRLILSLRWLIQALRNKALGSDTLAVVAIIETTTNVFETPGHGLTGTVDGKIISVGQPKLPLPDWAKIQSSLITEIRIDGRIAGYIGLSDPLRTDAKTTIKNLFALGVKRILLVSGDREETVAKVANELGIREHFASMAPEQKLMMLTKTQNETKGTVAVVGDGINDAPALAAADIGIAMGARGATAASQSSDVVIVEDSIGRLAEAVFISKTAAKRAFLASTIGMALALIAMICAAFGFLNPSESAIVQEFIDAAAISFALVGSRSTIGQS